MLVCSRTGSRVGKTSDVSEVMQRRGASIYEIKWRRLVPPQGSPAQGAGPFVSERASGLHWTRERQRVVHLAAWPCEVYRVLYMHV